MLRIVLALITLAALPLAAQQGRGSISGTVTDATGAAVPAVSVRITNAGTNAVTAVESNESGYFTAPPNVSFTPGPDGLNRSATFGTITSARDPRIIQFGLKLIF